MLKKLIQEPEHFPLSIKYPNQGKFIDIKYLKV